MNEEFKHFYMGEPYHRCDVHQRNMKNNKHCPEQAKHFFHINGEQFQLCDKCYNNYKNGDYKQTKTGGYMEETVEFTQDDVISIKTALTKLGISTPESNDLANSQILSMVRKMALRIREGIYEMPK